MKISSLKSLLCAASIAFATGAFAQTTGDIKFFSLQAGTALGTVFDVNGTTRLVGANFLAELWIGSTTDDSTYTSLGTAIGLGFGGNASFDGQLNGPTYTVAGTVGGNTRMYQVRAWDTRTGASFAAATVRGKSGPVSVQLGGSDGVNPAFTTPDTKGFTSFSLQVIPEPTTIALGILGGTALLFRRRKV